MSHFLLNLANRSAGRPSMPQARPYSMPVFLPTTMGVSPNLMTDYPAPPPGLQSMPSIPYEPPQPDTVDRAMMLDAPVRPHHDDDVEESLGLDYARNLRPLPDFSPVVPHMVTGPPRALEPGSGDYPGPRGGDDSAPSDADLPPPLQPQLRVERIIETHEVQLRPDSTPESPSMRNSGPEPGIPAVDPVPRALPAEPSPPPAPEWAGLDDPRPVETTQPPREPLRARPQLLPASEPSRPLVEPGTEREPANNAVPQRAQSREAEVSPDLRLPAPQPDTPADARLPNVQPRPTQTETHASNGEIAQPTVITVQEPVAPHLPEVPAPPPLERTQPAIAQSPPMRVPPVRLEPPSPTVNVRIGAVNMQVEPPASLPPARPARRRAQGFDGYRRLRRYIGWED